MLKCIRICAILAGLLVGPGIAHAQVPEIPQPGLGDIARAMMTPRGPVIIYDPMICASIGMLACRFFRAHEYGHISLGHLMGGVSPAIAEMQADCFAAVNAQPAEVEAGIQAFMRQGRGGDATHGTGFQRAQRVTDMRATGNCHW